MALLDLLGIDSSTGQMRRFKNGDTVNGAGDMFLGQEQSITGAKTFGASTLKVAGSTSGSLTLNAAAVAGNNTITLPALTGTAILDATTSVSGASWVLDEDDMVSNSDTKVPTQQSVKAYVDAQLAAYDTPVDSVNGMTGNVTLDTDDIAENPGATNLYFTDARAKSAAVVDSTAGSETDQAPSVAAMKLYADGAASAAVAAIDYPVDSVNGYTGAVSLNTDDIAEDPGASNQYFTDARAKAAAVVNNTSGAETDQAASVSAMKSYVDNAVGTAVVGLLDYKGGYNASTNTPDLDTAPSGIKKGDTYTVTAAGTFYTEELEIGDVLIAEVDNAASLADWTIVQKNLLSPLNADTITLANEGSDTQNFIAFGNAATGAQELKTNANLTFNASTGLLSVGELSSGNVTLSGGSALQTGTSSGNTVELKAYDVDGASYVSFATLTAGNTPTMDLSSAVTSGGEQIQTPSNSATLSNKTISGNDNTISDIGVSSLANGTDGALITWDTDGVATTLNPGDATKALVSNGAGAMPSYQTVEILLSSTAGINGKSASTTNLYTVPAGKTAIITRAVVRLTSASALTAAGSAGIGIGAGEDDIFDSTVLSGILATSDAYMFSNVMGKFRAAASTEVIKLGIDAAYTGTTATLAVDLFGYLV